MKRFLPAVLLALTVGGLYLPLARYGYVHDDLVMIRSISASRVPDLSPVGTTFYRPMGTLYCHTVYAVFGMNTAGFHLLAIIMLYITALVVRRVAAALTRDDVIAWGAAFLYAAAAHLHLDAQMWMVGVFDNGATLFSLLCLLMIMRGQTWLSALWFAIALGFKESAAPIVVVLAFWIMVHGQGRKAILQMWPHALVLIAWIIMKSMGTHPLAITDDHPYAWGLLGGHILKNIGLYVTWLIPVPFGFLAIIALMGWTCIRRPAIGVFLLIWTLLMLLPPVILVQHAFRYYAIMALPPVAIGMAIAIRSLPFPRQWQTASIVAIATIQIVANLFFIQGHVGRGIHDDEPARDDGYNHLIRRSLQGE